MSNGCYYVVGGSNGEICIVNLQNGSVVMKTSISKQPITDILCMENIKDSSSPVIIAGCLGESELRIINFTDNTHSQNISSKVEMPLIKTAYIANINKIKTLNNYMITRREDAFDGSHLIFMDPKEQEVHMITIDKLRSSFTLWKLILS